MLSVGGKLSTSNLKSQGIKASQEYETIKMQKLINQYLLFLSKMGVNIFFTNAHRYLIEVYIDLSLHTYRDVKCTSAIVGLVYKYLPHSIYSFSLNKIQLSAFLLLILQSPVWAATEKEWFPCSCTETGW